MELYYLLVHALLVTARYDTFNQTPIIVCLMELYYLLVHALPVTARYDTFNQTPMLKPLLPFNLYLT